MVEEPQTQVFWLLFSPSLHPLPSSLKGTQEEDYPTPHPKRPSHQKPLVIKINFFKPQNTDLLTSKSEPGTTSIPLFQQSLPYQEGLWVLSKFLSSFSACSPCTALGDAGARTPCPPEPYGQRAAKKSESSSLAGTSGESDSWVLLWDSKSLVYLLCRFTSKVRWPNWTCSLGFKTIKLQRSREPRFHGDNYLQ